jgi:hypothetical protein
VWRGEWPRPNRDQYPLSLPQQNGLTTPTPTSETFQSHLTLSFQSCRYCYFFSYTFFLSKVETPIHLKQYNHQHLLFGIFIFVKLRSEHGIPLSSKRINVKFFWAFCMKIRDSVWATLTSQCVQFLCFNLNFKAKRGLFTPNSSSCWSSIKVRIVLKEILHNWDKAWSSKVPFAFHSNFVLFNIIFIIETEFYFVSFY